MITPTEARARELGPFRGMAVNAIPAVLSWLLLVGAVVGAWFVLLDGLF